MISLKRYKKNKVLNQVANKARLVKNGPFTDSWNNSYSFSAVSPWIGGATVQGHFSGTVKKDRNVLIIEAKAQYQFFDTFTDPASIRQHKIGTSALKDIPYDFSKPWWNPGNLGAAYFAADTEFLGTPYEINGKWNTKIEGSIRDSDE
ncbi:MAG: hypothetical protein KDJ75_04720 [Alphaproteobacteria bacterium]|nr:hypothetical protein [Alphaproteobacteria bacterium]